MAKRKKQGRARGGDNNSKHFLNEASELHTPVKKKRYVESECRKMLEATKAINPEIASYLGGAYGARRQQAIVNYLDRAEEEFKGCGLTSVADTFVQRELSPFNNYNHLDSENDLSIGAALWILEKLRASGKMPEAFKILPNLAGDMNAWYLPIDFYHPCYSNDLIEAVIHVLLFRYGDFGNQSVVITEENAKGKRPDESYVELLRLLPQDDVERSCAAFKDKVWELVRRYSKCCAYYDKRLEQIERELEQVAASMTGAALSHPVIQSYALGTRPFDGTAVGSPFIGSNKPLPGGTEAALTDGFELAKRGKEYIRRKTQLSTDFDAYLQMNREDIRRQTGSREMADAISGFSITNPYEMCFALFYLIDNGEDAPWLIGSGSSLMLFVARMLPWHMEEDLSDEQLDEWFDGMEYNKNGWMERESPLEVVDYYHEKHNGKNLAQIIYQLCRGVVPTGLHPFDTDRVNMIADGMEEHIARRITDTAELMFLHQFQAKQFSGDGWPLAEEDEEAFVPEESELSCTGSKAEINLGGYWGKIAKSMGVDVAQSEGSALQQTGADTAEELQSVRSQLDEVRKQVKGLRKALAETRRSADTERTKYEQELSTLRREHRELADLRELVFNREHETTERLEKTTKAYTYPYETIKRTVIFGGHDTFLKAIKPMLPNVKFVDAQNLSFNPEIIRNADVVWIQNNCMSHSQYWSIVKNCKLAKVQMRYFAYASAEKCAEQLVDWDRK